MPPLSVEAQRAVEKLLDAGRDALLSGKNIRSRPKCVFHFTDCSGLIGLISDKTLWASLATALNDLSEMTYGVERGRELLRNGGLRVSALPLGQVERFLDRTKAPREWGMEWRTYVTSFCEVADTAAVWLHYGRDGLGIAVCFDTSRIEQAPYHFVPVLYDEGEQDALLRKIVETIDRALVDALTTIKIPGERDMLVSLASDWTANAIWAAAPLQKDVAFKSEQEWRLVTYDPFGPGVPDAMQRHLETFFRPVANRVVPYKKLKYDQLPATEIILGHSSPMLDTETALAVLMEKSLKTRLPVSRSRVTVRP
jgi:Protein of unknown function (DUF2971)